MHTAKALEFLNAKLTVYLTNSALPDSTRNSLRRSVEIHLAPGAQLGQSVSGIKALDKEFDVKMRSFLTKAEIERASHELKARYGFSSLSATGDMVAKRVLKRGAFKDSEEAQILRDFLLSGQYADDALRKEDVAKLEELLADYERN